MYRVLVDVTLIIKSPCMFPCAVSPSHTQSSSINQAKSSTMGSITVLGIARRIASDEFLFLP